MRGPEDSKATGNVLVRGAPITHTKVQGWPCLQARQFTELHSGWEVRDASWWSSATNSQSQHPGQGCLIQEVVEKIKRVWYPKGQKWPVLLNVYKQEQDQRARISFMNR